MSRPLLLSLLSGMLLLALVAPVSAHPEVTDDPHHDDDPGHELEHAQDRDPDEALQEHDEHTEGMASTGPSAKVTKNLAVAGRGDRLVPNATTDVWAHDGYAYLGTFNSPCGTGEGYGGDALVDGLEGPGVPVFNVENPTRPAYVGSLPSVEGSRVNDVKVAAMNQGDVLVHSNERCAGGPGGFEVYDVADPTNPVHLAHVQTDDINAFLRDRFGITDVGVHNLYLFTRDGRDYVAAQVEGLLGSFQVFDITDPAAAELVSWFGAEYVEWPGVDWATTDDFGLILQANAYLRSGFGRSRNRWLHDHYVSDDGQRAYLANWDEGLLLVDLGALDGSPATLVSQARDPENGSLDGEVNSHSVWPTADERIVVEGEEDFSAWEAQVPPGNLTFGQAREGNPAAPLPGSAIATVAGDDFEADQTGNAGILDEDALTVTAGPLDGETYQAIELSGDQPKLADVGPVEGAIVFIGRACNGDVLLNTEQFSEEDVEIAVVRRGACTFREKNFNADALGADAIVIANNLDSTPWSGLRIWDYADPQNPVLASTFDTQCSASTAPGGPCDPRGTYSSHNVIVEGTKAYVSWYADGVLVIDVADPYNPVEVARYHEAGEEFEERNAGIQDVWGVYKVPEEPWVYASDRNGGLYVLKEYGSGSARKGK